LAEDGRMLPGYVQREFEYYQKCGRLEHGFLWVGCENCHEERLVTFRCTNSRRFRRTSWITPGILCPTPFGPARGGAKSLPAILSARVVEDVAWPRFQPFR